LWHRASQAAGVPLYRQPSLLCWHAAIDSVWMQTPTISMPKPILGHQLLTLC
jgi:hypothetical protein